MDEKKNGGENENSLACIQQTLLSVVSEIFEIGVYDRIDKCLQVVPVYKERLSHDGEKDITTN